jgi:hypothetical protein
VVNQWHVLTQGFVLVSETKAARLYFVFFHMITVVLILNIFIAFVIEAFVLQLEYGAASVEKTMEDKINCEIEKSPSLREEFARLLIMKKAQRTEVFLQRMFEQEILPELEAKEAVSTHPSLPLAPLSPPHTYSHGTHAPQALRPTTSERLARCWNRCLCSPFSATTYNQATR